MAPQESRNQALPGGEDCCQERALGGIHGLGLRASCQRNVRAQLPTAWPLAPMLGEPPQMGVGLCLAAGFPRVGQGRAGSAAAQFPPAPSANEPALGKHHRKLGKTRRLTRSARLGRMGPQ